MWKRREKLKVVEVLSLHCLDREPRPGAQNNRWVAEVKAEVRGPVYAHPARIINQHSSSPLTRP